VSTADLGGILAPITTPFDAASGDVSPQHLKDNIARLLADGLDGIVVAGSTGEAPLLDPDEQRRAVGWARAVIPEGKWLVVGTGAESTRQAIALTRAAAEEGADAVLVRPPSYFPAVAARALANYFRAVADASRVPVLVYNIPKYTRISLPPELLQELSSHTRIVGAKDSSGDLKNLAAYREAAPQWVVFVGSGSLLLSALELECDGGIVATACFAARLCADLLAAYRAGDRGAAVALQDRIGPLDKEIVGKLGPAGVKAAMDAVGLYGGPTRPPLAPLGAAERDRVALLVRGD
jgi:dihydrodipicolinate synthase/N-acetylneuraminate lyase